MSDVAELADRLAGALDTEYRIEAGQRVGVIMRNQLAFVVSLMAIARRGAVAVLFNSRETPGQIGAAVADASCVVVIADGARAVAPARAARPDRVPRPAAYTRRRSRAIGRVVR